MVQILKKNTYISMNDKLKKELLKLIGDDFKDNCVMEDMTPIMSEIYHWGVQNITQKEMKRIIRDRKKKLI
tara:strand:- start:14 stop:226 length:213 start_codon:yes stop_codon:yes gene_type:complete